MTQAYQTGDVSLPAPLDFSYLIFAALWGNVFFGSVPPIDTLFRMLLIICAGIIIAWREQLNKMNKIRQQSTVNLSLIHI